MRQVGIIQAALFFSRHVSSRQPGDSASFLSFSGTEEFSNGLAGGNGAGNEAVPEHGAARGAASLLAGTK